MALVHGLEKYIIKDFGGIDAFVCNNPDKINSS
jgi:hypothetical protein